MALRVFATFVLLPHHSLVKDSELTDRALGWVFIFIYFFLLFQMVVAERLESELLPEGSSDNGRVEGKATLDGAWAPGSSQAPNTHGCNRNNTSSAPRGLFTDSCQWGLPFSGSVPGLWVQLLPSLDSLLVWQAGRMGVGGQMLAVGVPEWGRGSVRQSSASCDLGQAISPLVLSFPIWGMGIGI